MLYKMEIFDDREQYSCALEGETFASSIFFSIDDKDKALAMVETFVESGKVVALWCEDSSC